MSTTHRETSEAVALPRTAPGAKAPGDIVLPRQLTTMHDRQVAVPDGDGLVHLAFLRFAGCPICNLHLRSFVRRNDELVKAGIHEVAVFHSSRDELLEHEAELPFAVIPDPDKQLYREFGVETSLKALADPRAWPGIVRGVLGSLWAALRGHAPLAPRRPEGGGLGLPADLLIAPNGRVLAATYGAHASDQWSVDELLAVASSTRAELP